MTGYSPFGAEVKIKLMKSSGKTQAWLIQEVKDRTGLYVDAPYMSRILRGKCHPPKIVKAIKDILDITD